LKSDTGRFVVCLLALAGLAAALGGCGLLGQQVVARVDKRTLTLKQFEVLLGQAQGGVAPLDSTRRRALVDDWVDRTELVAEAESMHLDTLPAVTVAVRGQAEQAMAEELFRRNVVLKVKVSEPDMRVLYEQRKEARKVADIVVTRPEVADEVKRQLDHGMPFEQAARQYSQDTRTAPGGGVVADEVYAGELPLELEAPVMRLKPGEVSGPIHYQTAYIILKLLAVRPAERGPYDQEKMRLENLLRRRSQEAYTQKWLSDLKARRKYVVEDADIRRFVDRIVAAPGDTLPTLPPAVLAEPLARFVGGPYTVGDLLRDAEQSSLLSRPSLGSEPQVRQAVDNGATFALLVAEARSEQLDRDPEVVQKLRQLREVALSRAVVGRVLGHLPQPGEAELRAQYELRKGEFVNQGQAEVSQVVTPSESGAREAAREARANVDFFSLQRRYSKPTAEEARDGGEARVVFDGSRPALQDSLGGRQGNEIVGPVASGGRYYVFRVRAVYPPMNMSFDQARSTLLRQLANEQQTRVLQEHLTELKRRWPPQVNVKSVLAAKPAKLAPAGAGSR